MAAYPTLPVDLRASNDLPRGSRKVDDDGAGHQHVRKTARDKHTWTLVHTKLTFAQHTALIAHYDANGGVMPTLTFAFLSPFDGVSYVARYLRRPVPRNEEGPYVTLTVSLTQAS